MSIFNRFSFNCLGLHDIQLIYVIKLNTLYPITEIYTKEEVKVLSPQQQNLYDTLDNPLNFAGTFWYFISQDANDNQRLTIDDATSLTEPVIVKVK